MLSASTAPAASTGGYDLAVDRESLPAQYASDGISRRIETAGAARTTVDVVVTPLDSIRGRVYLDGNANGRFDSGEGRSGIVVRLEQRVTATDSNGLYGFYNLAPGDYLVELDEGRLAETFAVRDARMNVGLLPHRSVTGVDFALTEKQKPVILKRLGQ